MTPSSFTQSYEVPHDRIGLRKVLVVHQAITRAFELIRKEGFVLGSALENDITIKLLNVLNNKVLNRGEVDGFDRTFFGKARRVEVVNFNGTKKAKKPDICFDLQRENQVTWDQEQDALFAECKPVDKKHLLKNHYCAVGKDCTGIERFVIGDYAWSMEEGIMIGYVRDGFTIHPDLADAQGNQSKRMKLGDPSLLVEIRITDRDPAGVPLYRSTHKRLFLWNNGSTATPIDLYHSWHDCV